MVGRHFNAEGREEFGSEKEDLGRNLTGLEFKVQGMLGEGTWWYLVQII